MALTEEHIIEVPGVTSHWVRLGNGAKAHYSTAGHTGPAVILCHGGLPGSSGIAGFRYMLPFLGEHGFRVYAPDFPGFGLSDNSEEYWPRYGTNDHVDFIQRFADAMCLDTFSITGNSMGCNSTLNYLLAHPERVTNFALIAGTVGDINPERIPGTMDVRALNRDVFDGTPESMRKVLGGVVQDTSKIPEDVAQMRTYAANLQRESLKAYWNYGDILSKEPRFKARTTSINRIDRIGIPGIYIFGVDDAMVPVENGYLDEDAAPNIQFFYPTDCGHQAQNDRPDLFNQLFLEFFRDNKVSRETADASGASKRRAELPELVEQAVLA